MSRGSGDSPGAPARPPGDVVYREREIAGRVREMGEEIGRAYPPAEELLALGLLKGSFIFLADLVRQIPRPVRVDFLVASSYGAGTRSSGSVRLLYAPEEPLEGVNVLLVEDIIESGTTLNRLVPELLRRRPRSLEVCTLLHKRVASDLVKDARWVGFEPPPGFLVGYGLDHSERYRNLPYIAAVGAGGARERGRGHV